MYELNTDDYIIKLKDFLKGNWGKVWYIYQHTDELGNFEETPYRLRPTSQKINDCKRMAYFSTKKEKTFKKDFIDRIVIDCDDGIIAAMRVLHPLFGKLNNPEYWIIAGTEKKNVDSGAKPYDSGSIIIMFNPIKVDLDSETTKFRLLVKLLNLNVGDPLNIGYAHKNPQWHTTHTFEKQGNYIIDFNTLYSVCLAYFGITEEEINIRYDKLFKDEYTNRLIDEALKINRYEETLDEKDAPTKYLITDYFRKSHKTDELKQVVDEIIHDDAMPPKLKPSMYVRYLLFFDRYLDNNYYDYPAPTELTVKYNITKSKEKSLYKEANKWFIGMKGCFDASMENLLPLGFTEEQVKEISASLEFGRKKGRATNAKKFAEKRKRIKELVRAKEKKGRLIESEQKELSDLTTPKKNKKEMVETTCSVIKGGYGEEEGGANPSIYTINVRSKSKRNGTKYNTYYVDENNKLYEKQYIIDNFFGGHCYDVSRQFKRFGFKPYFKIDYKNKKFIPVVEQEMPENNIHNETLRNEEYEKSLEFWNELYHNDTQKKEYITTSTHDENFQDLETMKRIQMEEARQMMEQEEYGDSSTCLPFSNEVPAEQPTCGILSKHQLHRLTTKYEILDKIIEASNMGYDIHYSNGGKGDDFISMLTVHKHNDTNNEVVIMTKVQELKKSNYYL